MTHMHIFQHVPFESAGIIEPWARRRGFNLSATRFFNGQTPPDLEPVDWLVIMGGPMGVFDDVQHPWLAEEKKAIGQAISQGTVVLGICLGAQLIAEALGASVRTNLYKEIGWHTVFLDSGALDLDIAAALPPQWEALHWHADTFDIPDGARLLASSAACRNQGFIYGDRVVALQFHLEMDRTHALGLVTHGSEDLLPGDYVQTEREILAPDAPFVQSCALMEQFLDHLNRLTHA